ncbi:MAG: 3'-5' exonuclease, partial [Armatimonadetes bacterium]|nr:3'-5' exonuclease [Candidatus Hippobium faecium]
LILYNEYFPITDNYTVIDTETTGLDSYKDKIIQFGAIKIQNGKVVNSFNSLINPEKHITKKITKINGITDDMVINQPIFSEIENQIINFMQDDILIGHNINFDIRFLNNEAKKFITNSTIDTLSLAQKRYNFENHKLATLAQRLNLPLNNHDAFADCTTIVALYEKMKEDVYKEIAKIEFKHYIFNLLLQKK